MVTDSLHRRQFLASASASAFLAATHGPLAWAAPDPGVASEAKEDAARIVALRLLTSAPLASMRDFYEGALGLAVVAEHPGELTVAAGETRITFVAAADRGEPFYHVAFNIPENKLLLARDWQRERSPLLPALPGLRDPRFPEDVIHFRHWNAHSVFFWDPAGNLLEYIARHDLDNGAPGAFGSEDLLCASEIGLVVDEVPALASEIKAAFDLELYGRASERFAAVGDEHGLLIVFQRGRDWWGKAAEVFPTTVGIRGGEGARYAASDSPHTIVRG